MNGEGPERASAASSTLGRGELRRRLENPREFPQGTIDRGCDPIVERRIAREHLETPIERPSRAGVVNDDLLR